MALLTRNLEPEGRRYNGAMPRTFLIDTDTASDDAVALIMALRAPDVHVAAITVVAGNVSVDACVRNALATVEFCGADVPVFRGAAAPLERPAVFAHFYHGRDGMGDIFEQGYPAPSRTAEPGDAVDAIIDTVRAHPGLVLVTLGPLTNVARAIQRAPDIVPLVDRCVVMGGNPGCVGNVTPAAEFNIYVDPDAARIVLRSGLPVELVGWQLGRFEATFGPEEIAALRAIDTDLARFSVDCNATAIRANRRQTDQEGLALFDPVAMAIAIDPAICTDATTHHVDVEVDSDLTRGMTVVDHLDITHDERNRSIWAPMLERGVPSVSVCWALDTPGFKSMLRDALATGP